MQRPQQYFPNGIHCTSNNRTLEYIETIRCLTSKVPPRPSKPCQEYTSKLLLPDLPVLIDATASPCIAYGNANLTTRLCLFVMLVCWKRKCWFAEKEHVCVLEKQPQICAMIESNKYNYRLSNSEQCKSKQTCVDVLNAPLFFPHSTSNAKKK